MPRSGGGMTESPRRRIVVTAPFRRALRRLGSPAAEAFVRSVARSIAQRPEHAPQVTGTDVRVLRTRSYAGLPALRIFFTSDAQAVYLLDVTPYDELSVTGYED